MARIMAVALLALVCFASFANVEVQAKEKANNKKWRIVAFPIGGDGGTAVVVNNAIQNNVAIQVGILSNQELSQLNIIENSASSNGGVGRRLQSESKKWRVVAFPIGGDGGTAAVVNNAIQKNAAVQIGFLSKQELTQVNSITNVASADGGLGRRLQSEAKKWRVVAFPIGGDGGTAVVINNAIQKNAAVQIGFLSKQELTQVNSITNIASADGGAGR